MNKHVLYDRNDIHNTFIKYIFSSVRNCIYICKCDIENPTMDKCLGPILFKMMKIDWKEFDKYVIDNFDYLEKNRLFTVNVREYKVREDLLKNIDPLDVPK